MLVLITKERSMVVVGDGDGDGDDDFVVVNNLLLF